MHPISFSVFFAVPSFYSPSTIRTNAHRITSVPIARASTTLIGSSITDIPPKVLPLVQNFHIVRPRVLPPRAWDTIPFDASSNLHISYSSLTPSSYKLIDRRRKSLSLHKPPQPNRLIFSVSSRLLLFIASQAHPLMPVTMPR